MKKSHDGFTLIELLVVISIIALLISILLPALRTAREAARNAGCLSNHKQLAVALFAYAAENNDFPPTDVPFDSLGNQYGAWYERLFKSIYGVDIDDTTARTPYTERGSSVFTCPSDPCVSVYKIARSYAANWHVSGYFDDSNKSWSAHKRMADFINPGKDWYLLDGWGSQASASSMGHHEGYLASSHSYWQGERSIRMKQGVFLVHNNGFNVLFLDGHAVTFQGGTKLESLIQGASKIFWAE